MVAVFHRNEVQPVVGADFGFLKEHGCGKKIGLELIFSHKYRY